MKIFSLLFLSTTLLQSADAKIRGGNTLSSGVALNRDLMGSSSDDKGGSMGSSSGDSNGESPFSGSANLGAGECEICSSDYRVRPNSITFQYSRESGNPKHQDRSTCGFRDELFPELANVVANGEEFQVSEGGTFTVYGSFEANTDMMISNDGYSCVIHTSCSQPLVAGDQFGPFKILSGGDTCSGTFTGNSDPSTGGSSSNSDTDCEICSKDYKVRPDSLTLKYVSGGKTSRYQDRATCLEGSYPDSAQLTFSIDKNAETKKDVVNGMIFTLDGPFEANTVVNIPGFGECAFHTSCSQPLVAGDQIGPFIVMGGGRCSTDRDPDPPFGGLSPTPPAPLPPAPTPGSYPPGDCEICYKNGIYTERPQTLYVQYFAAGQNSGYQDESKASCREAAYPPGTQLRFTVDNAVTRFFDNVQDGQILTLEGPFDAYTYVDIASWGSCRFHTSCSQPLVAGDRIGPFQIIGSDDRCTSGPDPPSGGSSPSPPGPTPPGPTPPTDGNCVICDDENRNKPDSLTFMYSMEGQNSFYQPAKKASCRKDTYPDSTVITVMTKDKEYTYAVTSGETFTIPGPFNAHSEFMIEGYGDCTVHTSCSVPLVVGDQIGPFIVLEGNECKIERTPAPSPTPVDPPNGGSADTPSPTPFPTMPPTDPPTMPPTDPPTMPPTDPPTAPPSPLSTPLPTPDPTPPPSPSPSASPSNMPSVERSEVPSPSPSERPTPVASNSPSAEPSAAPSVAPSDEPSGAPTPLECIRPDKKEYTCGETIVVDFKFDDAFDDDWIGIYPCETTIYLHSEVWQWGCGAPGCKSPLFSGSVTFDGLPWYNGNGPHTWPVAPYKTEEGPITRCFKAVYLREDGPSVPPYVDMCESFEFSISENDTPGCGIRPENPNVIGDDENRKL